MAKQGKKQAKRRGTEGKSRGGGIKKGKGAGRAVAGQEVSELIDMNQAIELLKTTRPTFYRWLRQGKIKGMKVGRQWRFYREELERFLKGEEPRIELPADIRPLIRELRRRIQELGLKEEAHKGTEDVSAAVSLMIQLAVAMRASDIHITPHMGERREQSIAVLRYRVDGVLHVAAEFDIRLLPAIIERWKTMASCSIHERIKPQDGRIVLKLQGKMYDFRVSFAPACLGESVTARILDPDVVPLKLDRIEYAQRDKEKILRWIQAPWGLIVVTGPTGSGKTTVLYACLNYIARPQIKAMSVEDPVEFLLPWVVQLQLNSKAGVTFATAMRSILRSDPDVILVGELRDRETLQIAQQSSLTGHLVMTTLHADESARALKRMVEMGTDPFVVADSTKLIIAQRLVRMLCTNCSTEGSPPEAVLEHAAQLARGGGLDWDSLPKKFREPVGCAKCAETGYRRRNVIAEVLEVTPEIGRALRDGASVDELRAIAVRQGMTTLAADGIRRAGAGLTSLGEVMRAIGER